MKQNKLNKGIFSKSRLNRALLRGWTHFQRAYHYKDVCRLGLGTELWVWVCAVHSRVQRCTCRWCPGGPARGRARRARAARRGARGGARGARPGARAAPPCAAPRPPRTGAAPQPRRAPAARPCTRTRRARAAAPAPRARGAPAPPPRGAPLARAAAAATRPPAARGAPAPAVCDQLSVYLNCLITHVPELQYTFFKFIKCKGD